MPCRTPARTAKSWQSRPTTRCSRISKRLRTRRLVTQGWWRSPTAGAVAATSPIMQPSTIQVSRSPHRQVTTASSRNSRQATRMWWGSAVRRCSGTAAREVSGRQPGQEPGRTVARTRSLNGKGPQRPLLHQGIRRRVRRSRPDTWWAKYLLWHRTWVGGFLQVGGTSEASPIIAAVYALSGNTANYPAAIPYSHPRNLFDVTHGSNGSCGVPVCSARVGWDGPTGIGTQTACRLLSMNRAH